MATTPVYGIAYRGNGELGWPLNQITEEMANSVEAALGSAGGNGSLRTYTANLESDSGRDVVNDTSFGADFACNFTMPRPASGILSVELWMEPRTTVGTGGGLMGFEVRDTSAGGTLRLAASDARAVYSVPAVAGFHSSGGTFTDVIPGTSTDLFVRLMFRVTTAATTVNFARCRLAARGSP